VNLNLEQFKRGRKISEAVELDIALHVISVSKMPNEQGKRMAEGQSA